jgi:hypothetical protein
MQMSAKNAKLITAAMIVSFALAAYFAFGAHNKDIAALLYSLTGGISILCSREIAQVINETRNTNYTRRLPILWGIGSISVAIALFFWLT